MEKSLERPWGRSRYANYVASVVPKAFMAYVRVLHPALAGTREVFWSEIAHQFMRKPHAEMQWDAITSGYESDRVLSEITPPYIGCLPEKQIKALVAILRNHTSTPEECYFGVWDGWGAIAPEPPWTETKRFALPDRSYYVLQGSIETATTSITSLHWQSASIWWTKDRTWFVSTEIDLMCTFVGGTRACIEEIMADHQLETWRATLDDRVDIAGDQINALK